MKVVLSAFREGAPEFQVPRKLTDYRSGLAVPLKFLTASFYYIMVNYFRPVNLSHLTII